MHDGSGTYGSLEAGDDSYRYSGANPNNYVCFGSDAATCPTDNLYRIIGVFGDQVKLMKSTSYGNYAWDSGNSNTWDASTKPDIYTTLNTTYLNSIGEWASKIASHTWEVGGMARDTSATAKDYYQTEVGASQSGYVETMKIGLMYVSDYGYAAAPSNWTTELHNYESATSTNWAYLDSNEWTISRRSDESNYAFDVYNTGYVIRINSVMNTYAVRPSFYLNSDVQYISGTGTESDPFRIA